MANDLDVQLSSLRVSQFVFPETPVITDSNYSTLQVCNEMDDPVLCVNGDAKSVSIVGIPVHHVAADSDVKQTFLMKLRVVDDDYVARELAFAALGTVDASPFGANYLPRSVVFTKEMRDETMIYRDEFQIHATVHWEQMDTDSCNFSGFQAWHAYIHHHPLDMYRTPFRSNVRGRMTFIRCRENSKENPLRKDDYAA